MFKASPFPAKPMFEPGEETNKLKSMFAVAHLRQPDNAFAAGCEVFGSDTGKALYVSMHWINDEFVLAEKARLLKTHGAQAFLPSREDYAREVWRLATNDRTPMDDRKYLMSLFGDVMGYKKSPEKPGIHQTINAQNVMIVKDHGSDEDWERKAQEQQFNLAKQAEEVLDVPSRTLQ